jgi:hypothetical protein
MDMSHRLKKRVFKQANRLWLLGPWTSSLNFLARRMTLLIQTLILQEAIKKKVNCK